MYETVCLWHIAFTVCCSQSDSVGCIQASGGGDYLPGCYPAIAVPGNLIQAKGTVDYLVDETHEMSQDPVSFESFRHIYTNVYHNGFGWIYGELIEITNPCERRSTDMKVLVAIILCITGRLCR